MTTCVRCVRRCAKARGPISAIQPTNRLQTRASIEFSILAVFRFAWVQTCEPGTHEGSHLPRCRHPAQARADRAFGPLAHTARCEPQTLQTLFSGRTVAKCCARAPRIGISPGRTPFAWGMCACADHYERLRPSPSSPPSQIVPGFPVPGRERLTGWERLNPVLARTSIVPGSNRSQGWGGNDCFSDSLCRSTLYKSFPVPGRCSLKRG